MNRPRLTARNLWPVVWPLVCLGATPFVHELAARHLHRAAGLLATGWLLLMLRQMAIGVINLQSSRTAGARGKRIFYAGHAAIQRLSIALAAGYALAAAVYQQYGFVVVPVLLVAFWGCGLKALADDARAQLIDLGLFKRRQASANPYDPKDERYAVWEAVNALGAKERKRRKYQTERLTRSFRPLELDDHTSMAEALAALPETRDKRLRAPDPASETHHLKTTKGDALKQLQRAVGDLHQRNVREGVPEDRHYYGILERAETGEVDRSYEVKPEEEMPQLRPDQVPEGIEKEEEERVWEVKE